MDDTASQNNPPADFNKLDLSQLQSFSFGTQWTQEKPASDGGRPRREDRRDGPGAERRDRRAFRRPAGAGEGGRPDDAQAPRGEFSGDRRPRRDGPGGEYRGGPRREGPGGDRGAPRSAPAGRGGYDRGPYDSPFYAATFYPEDTSFNALAQTIRKSCRTIELFEIARTVVAKTDRFVVVVALKQPAAGAEAAPARKGFYVSVPDGIPFETDEAAVAHVLANHLGTFFDSAEVEVDPPKGNFQVINKCSLTGELLGPPNYHRYNQIVQQHHAARVGSRMSIEAYRTRIETVRDPEVVNQWLAKMKKTTRYTWKTSAPAAAAAPAPVEGAAPEVAADAPAPLSFDTLEEARLHLLTNARDKVVRTTDSVRVSGKTAEAMPDGEIRRAIEGAWERQRRFPLDTANALRGRLRREHFTIFKKGSKGVSYVCAVKRKFRVPGQTFSDSIGSLISFIEANPMVRASELPAKFLNLVVPAAAPATESAPAEGAAAAAPALSVDDRARLSRMQGDLVWLVREGYVTEFIDGRLFAPPPMVEARKKEIESEEHDPENFPEVPAEPTPAASADGSAAPAAPASETPPAS